MENKNKFLQEVYQKGFNYEKRYHGCAQCTIAAIQEYFDVDDIIFKSASAFSGGVASTVEGHCGAFSGGVMLLNYFFGREKENFEDNEATEKAKVLTRILKNRFIQEYGGFMCEQVQTKIMGRSFVLMDPDQKKLFEEAGGHINKCPSVVGKAALYVAEILVDYEVPFKGFK